MSEASEEIRIKEEEEGDERDDVDETFHDATDMEGPSKPVELGSSSDNKAETTIVTGNTSHTGKDDCSDLTDNNNDPEEQTPKSFPQKLMEILSNDENVDVISWLHHGNGFIIHKKKTFASDILPKYFKASKFTSFTRKLNRWGFNRVPRGPETGAYFHKLFRRDKPELCLQMTSNSGNKYQSNPMQQNLLPNVPAMMTGAPMAQPPMGMFPYMPNYMMGNMPPQQQQALWHQHMQQMMMMQMHQQQHLQQQQGRMPMQGTPMPPGMMAMPPQSQMPPQDGGMGSPDMDKQDDGGMVPGTPGPSADQGGMDSPHVTADAAV